MDWRAKLRVPLYNVTNAMSSEFCTVGIGCDCKARFEVSITSL